MTIKDLHQETVDLLKANPRKVEQRRQAITNLATGKEATLNLDRATLRRRSGVWFSTTQGYTVAGKGELSVQLLGERVGALIFDSPSHSWLFHPKKEKLGPWPWSKNRKGAEEINGYLRNCKEGIQAKAKSVRQKFRVAEREIQWQLAFELQAPTKRRGGSIRGLCPVEIGTVPLEIGVSVNRKGEVKDRSTGNIDLLLRQPRGAVGGRLLVLELKAPCAKKAKDIQSTLKQAIRYATALEFEANGNLEDTEARRTTLATYRSAFGLKKTGKGVLQIGVVIAMCDWGPDFQNTARQLLDEYCQDVGDSHIGWIDMLLYDVAGETAHGWRWLENWNPPPQLRRVKR